MSKGEGNWKESQARTNHVGHQTHNKELGLSKSSGRPQRGFKSTTRSDCVL